MQIHPDIAALRSDPALQRHAQAPLSSSLANWRESETAHAIAADLEAYDEGHPLGGCEELARLLSDLEFAKSFVDRWCSVIFNPLLEQPLAQVPARHNVGAGLTTIQLMSAGRTTLSLMAYEKVPGASEPTSVMFADREVCEIVLWGTASGCCHQIARMHNDSARINTFPMTYEPGTSVTLSARQQNRQFVNVEGAMLVLQLIRTPEDPTPTSQYSLDDGRLLHQANGNKRASQHLLALDVLGALGRADAVPAMEELALAEGEDLDLRWEAVRQTLALETASGMKLLGELSAKEHDSLSKPATSLQQSLIAANAQLSKETVLCPA